MIKEESVKRELLSLLESNALMIRETQRVWSSKLDISEIEKVLEGCKIRMSGEYNHGGYWEMDCGDLNRLCPSCKSILRGIILAQEKEIEFLEDKFIILDTPDNDELDAGIVRNDINERVNQLKESNEDLKRRLE